jgi:5-methylcytosine-specific restriction endonuclease McrA
MVAVVERMRIPCQHCGKELLRTQREVDKNRRHFCSKACQGQWSRRTEPHRYNCVLCGKQCSMKGNPRPKQKGLYCSRKCAGLVNGGARKGVTKLTPLALASWFHQWDQERKGQLAKVIERSLFPSPWKLHKIKLLLVCRVCGCPVEKGRLQCDSCNRSKWLKYRRERNKSCSHRKRCRKFGVPWDSKVRRRAVFKRDGYRCGICGKQTLKDGKMEGNKVHPLSPTVDHIVPLSHGTKGHTWDNVQCACWICNTKKSTRLYGSQMRLF